MRKSLCLTALLPLALLAGFGPASAQGVRLHGALLVAHPAISPGQLETVTLVARDAAGHAVAHASGKLLVSYAKGSRFYYLPATDARGTTRVTFTVPGWVRPSWAQLHAQLAEDGSAITVGGAFAVRPAVSKRTVPPLQIKVQVEPHSVTAPQPVWIIVTARSVHGPARHSAPVDAEVMLPGGAVHLGGSTDSHGVSTLRVDTAKVNSDGAIEVGVVVRSGNDLGMGTAEFFVHAVPAPTPTPSPTLTPTPLPTLTSTPTPTPLPTDTPTATPTPTTMPTATPVATAVFAPVLTSTPTDVPTPTFTIVPSDTPTPASTPTAVPTNTALPTATTAPTMTPTVSPNCPGSDSGCRQAVLNLINQARADYSQQTGISLPPYRLDMAQSNGVGSCVGSIGHSKAMAQSGFIWHTNASYPSASFPNNICVNWTSVGENVGMAQNGDEMNSLTTIHEEMMSEQHDPAYCSQYTNHACSIVSSTYNSVGVGIVVTTDGTTYLTEDFTG